MSLTTVRQELDGAVTNMRRWKDAIKSQDSGSYCESPSSEFSRMAAVIKAYKDLINALRNYCDE